MARFLSGIVERPRRDILTAAALCVALVADLALSPPAEVLAVVAAVGAIPTAVAALRSLRKARISIEVFNGFALLVSFWLGDFRSAGFIGLMLASARILEWKTETRTKDAVEELLRLKPSTATIVRGDGEEEIGVDEVKAGDVLTVRNGARVPVDGSVVYGESLVNEASVTGESVPVKRSAGDPVISGTLVESGAIKIRATKVGKDSTIERMAELMRQASGHKSRSERLADRFAGFFLPAIAIFGVGVLVVTGDVKMMASVFLVACADDVAVAVPLAISAGLGLAAKRGVIVKGGEWLEVLSKMRIAVIDKTGTLTFGSFMVKDFRAAAGVDEAVFWKAVGSAEKYSEHPIGRAILREAHARIGEVPDPGRFDTVRGGGVEAAVDGMHVLVGSMRFLSERGIPVPAPGGAGTENAVGESSVAVAIGGRFAGTISIADVPRPEAAASLAELRRIGVGRVIMFTGDGKRVAADVSGRLGISEFRAEMTPEDKLREVEAMLASGPVGMVGDGVNDAPALARADVGIAMGAGGAAVAVEAADVVITTDDLSRLPEMVLLGRRVHSVIKGDMVIWAVSNAVGFALVLTGFLGPALAAFYNFATDFLPLINSARLFRGGSDSRKPI